MIDVSRRGMIGGLLGVMAAPAIVRAGIIMPVKKVLVPPAGSVVLPAECEVVAGANKILTNQMIAREAIKLFANKNAFLHAIDERTFRNGRIQV